MPKRKKAKSVLHRSSQKSKAYGETATASLGDVTTTRDAVVVEAEEGKGVELGSEGEEHEDNSEGGREDGDIGDRGDGGGGASGEGDVGEGRKKKPRISGLYQPPTHEELRTLKETQNLFHSNLMRLQITELLGEVRPSPCSELDQFLAGIRSTLMNLPSTPPVDLCEAVQGLPSKIHYPVELDPSSVKGKFTFRPPTSVKVVGSYLLKTAIKSDLNIDVALQIPEECLQAKDHLNYRYLHKRALYLCHVAAHLRRKKKGCGLERVEFGLSHGGPLMPLLLIKPKDKPQSRYTIRLHTTIPEAPFKPVKLAPDRNNLRPQAARPQLPHNLRSLVDTTDTQSSSADGATNLQPTPLYNSLVLSDMGGMERHLTEIYTAQQECRAMVDAVMLFRVWAKQRGLDQGYGSYSGFHFSMLLVHLLTQRKITPLMSSYQTLRIALQTIASSDWSTAGVSMATAVELSHPPLPSFHSHHSVIFVDSSGLLNVLCHLSLSRYTWLRHEAAVSLACLDNPATDGFRALFMTPVPFQMKFDLLIHVSPMDKLYSYLTKLDANEGEPLLLDGGSWPLPLIMERVLPFLVKGLGKRVKLVTLRPFNQPHWLLSKRPVLPCDSHLTVGVSLDPDHAFSVLDMGPAADSKQAAEFRSFWGEKAELRRFQDGSINEAVVWRGGSVGERRGVVTQVIRHLLNRHAGIPAECVVSTAGLLHPLISLPHYSHPQHNDSDNDTSSATLATGEEECQKIKDTFTELSKQLRGLKGLPLAITAVQEASAEFRDSTVFPAAPWSGKIPRKMLAKPSENNQPDCLYPCDSATPPFVPALEVVLQMESSGKWPSELKAISHIKTSFYTFISRALKDQCHLLCSPTMHHLDVLKNGYVFRLRIHYHRELAILRDIISTAKPHEATELKKRLSDMERNLVDRPLLTSILHGLSQQYSSLAPGARLCKRWVSAHLLTNHIADEVVELMVARLFIQPDPFTSPNSPECVLLRFLFLLSTHDWENEPLIVNFNNELSVADIADINYQFTSQRSQLPPCYIATPLHRGSSPLTSPLPSYPVFCRACLLARESLNLLSNQFTSANLATTDIKQAFRTPLTGYNVLIHLHKKHVPLATYGVDVATVANSTFSKCWSSRGNPTHFPVTEFNPAEKYLTDLELAFAEFCLFFYDKYGGRCIAVVWKPQAFVPQPFRVMHSFCKTQIANEKDSRKRSEVMFAPDMKAILADFELMGVELVSSVEVLFDSSHNISVP